MGALRRLLPIIFVAAMLAVSCSSANDSAAPPPNETDWPYQFVVDTVDGSTINTGDYAGHDLVLWFWAPW